MLLMEVESVMYHISLCLVLELADIAWVMWTIGYYELLSIHLPHPFSVDLMGGNWVRIIPFSPFYSMAPDFLKNEVVIETKLG